MAKIKHRIRVYVFRFSHSILYCNGNIPAPIFFQMIIAAPLKKSFYFRVCSCIFLCFGSQSIFFELVASSQFGTALRLCGKLKVLCRHTVWVKVLLSPALCRKFFMVLLV
jgi:hypothetical protein